MRESEIAMEAGRAAREGDKHKIPEIQKISEEFRRFMKEWGETRNKETTEFAQKNYPGMRTLTGQYLMREITLK